MAASLRALGHLIKLPISTNRFRRIDATRQALFWGRSPGPSEEGWEEWCCDKQALWEATPGHLRMLAAKACRHAAKLEQAAVKARSKD